MNYKRIVSRYVRSANDYRQQKEELETEREIVQDKLDELLSKRPIWLHIVADLAQLLQAELGYEDYEIFGPFGLGCTTSIHFYKKKVVHSLTLRPGNLDIGELRVVDFSRNIKEFSKDTIGDINGFNYPEIDIPKDASPSWFKKHTTKG